MTIIYILQIAWLLIFAFLVITTLIFTIFWGLCSNPRVQSLDDCIDFTQFGKFFTRQYINKLKLGRLYLRYTHIFPSFYLKIIKCLLYFFYIVIILNIRYRIKNQELIKRKQIRNFRFYVSL